MLGKTFRQHRLSLDFLNLLQTASTGDHPELGGRDKNPLQVGGVVIGSFEAFKNREGGGSGES